MNISVVGLGFGDEGKGHITNYITGLAKHMCVVRYCGGHQVGHMVYNNGVRHVFSNFGSGSLQGVPTYWDKACTIDPVGIVKEYAVLKSKGITPVLFINSECPVVTILDKYENILKDKKTGHGTVGVGFGTTIQREENFYSLKLIDLFYPQVLRIKLEAIIKYYNGVLDISQFMKEVDELLAIPTITRVDSCPKDYVNYVYEGSQGLMLDQHIGFFPHVTRASLVPPTCVDYHYVVTRAYCTRHGNGWMPETNFNTHVKVNPHEVNTGGVQGEFRRSLLDVSLLAYALERSHINTEHMTLAITCLDHIKDNCYWYICDGRVELYNNKEDFCKGIADYLGIMHCQVVMSVGDESSNITRLE